MCREITVITQGILSLSHTMYYFSLEFRMGTVRSNEKSVIATEHDILFHHSALVRDAVNFSK
jgi:hypothetical protein